MQWFVSILFCSITHGRWVQVRELAVGDLVEVRTQEAGNSVRRGRVAYVGETQFADGIWVSLG